MEGDDQIQIGFNVGCDAIVGAGYTFTISFPNGDGGSPLGQQFGLYVGLPAPPNPSIQINESTISGTQSAVVGQQISLQGTQGTQGLPHCMSLGGQQWTPPTGTAIGNYTASSASASVTPISSVNATGSNYQFYWVYPGNSLSTTYQYTMYATDANGQTVASPWSSAATATYNVTGPMGGTMTVVANPSVNVGSLSACSSPSFPGGAYMVYANGPQGSACPNHIQAYANGITLNSPVGYQNSSGGSFSLVQLISSDVNTGGIAPSYGAGLDTVYPYGGPPAADSPSVYLPSTSNRVSRIFNANMFLLWKSGAAGSIPVPLGYQSWGFSATALCNANCGTANNWTVTTNSAGTAGGFATSSPSQTSIGNNVLVDGYPTWTTVSH